MDPARWKIRGRHKLPGRSRLQAGYDYAVMVFFIPSMSEEALLFGGPDLDMDHMVALYSLLN